MKYYNYQVKGNMLFNSDIYIKLDYVKDINNFLAIPCNKCISSNINNFNVFANELIEYENNNKEGKRKDTLINYGVILTFLLDKKHNKEELSNLINEIVKHYNNLPFYSYLEHKGKGYYLHIYFSERYYNKNGYITETRAKNDRYRSAKSGKACKKEDADAVIWLHKGDLIKIKVSNFTNKVRFFRFSSKKHFNKVMLELKKWFISICEKIINVVVNVGFTLKRYTLAYLDKNKRINANIWHQAFREIEKHFIKAYEVLENTNYLEDAKESLDKLFIKYNNKLINDKQYYNEGANWFINFRYDKHVKFNLDLNDTYNKTLINSELLKEKFIKELNKIVLSYLPQIY